MAKALTDKGEKLITGGTVNHLIMWDLRQHNITGSKLEKAMDAMNITANKNSIVGDKSAVTPGGIRLGTPALTTRGFQEHDMEQVALYLLKALEISKRIQNKSGKKLADFVEAIEDDEEI